MNVELLRKVQKQIVEHPESLRMDVWNCGTAQCIAGHALMLTGHEWVAAASPDEFVLAKVSTSGTASYELGLYGMQSHRLFHTSDWPNEFQERYNAAHGFAERARIASARIDHFIATNGAE